MVSVIRSLSRGGGGRAEHQLRQRVFVGPDVAAVVPDGGDALGGERVHRPERTGQPERAADDLGAGGQVAVLGHRGGQPADEDHQGGAAGIRKRGGADDELEGRAGDVGRHSGDRAAVMALRPVGRVLQVPVVRGDQAVRAASTQS